MASVELLNYRVEGAGPPLLLIHGFGVSFNIWRSLAPLLHNHFQLVMIELPGIGDSPSPGEGSYNAACLAAIESVRQKLEIPKWSVLAYSMGVSVAAAYADAHPDSVAGVVFLCPPFLRGLRWWALRGLLWLDNRWSFIGDWVISGWRLYWLVALIGFNGRPNRLTREWVDEIATQPQSDLKSPLREIPHVSQLLKHVKANQLFLCGNIDLVSLRPPGSGLHVAFFTGDHSGPVVVAQPIAAQIIRFLTEKSGG
jgi:pimeloyl-ACP methyl ester carboxylesterase